MNHQDVPPKPASPPTAGLPRVTPEQGAPGPASVTWSAPHPDAVPVNEQSNAKARTLWKLFFAVVLLAVVGGLIWLALWLNSGAASTASGSKAQGVLQTTVTPAATPLPLPRDGVKPADYAVGDCFKDFDPEALASTVVPCDSGHSAQLVAVYRYPEGGEYPGAEALKAKALEACQATKLAAPANDYQLNYQRSFPSSTSWGSGDRRVDCYVTAPNGNVINASVLP